MTGVSRVIPNEIFILYHIKFRVNYKIFFKMHANKNFFLYLVTNTRRYYDVRIKNITLKMNVFYIIT